MEQIVLRAAQGYQLSQALYVTAKLGVADALADGAGAAADCANAGVAAPANTTAAAAAMGVSFVFMGLLFSGGRAFFGNAGRLGLGRPRLGSRGPCTLGLGTLSSWYSIG